MVIGSALSDPAHVGLLPDRKWDGLEQPADVRPPASSPGTACFFFTIIMVAVFVSEIFLQTA